MRFFRLLLAAILAAFCVTAFAGGFTPPTVTDNVINIPGVDVPDAIFGGEVTGQPVAIVQHDGWKITLHAPSRETRELTEIGSEFITACYIGHDNEILIGTPDGLWEGGVNFAFIKTPIHDQIDFVQVALGGIYAIRHSDHALLYRSTEGGTWHQMGVITGRIDGFSVNSATGDLLISGGYFDSLELPTPDGKTSKWGIVGVDAPQAVLEIHRTTLGSSGDIDWSNTTFDHVLLLPATSATFLPNGTALAQSLGGGYFATDLNGKEWTAVMTPDGAAVYSRAYGRQLAVGPVWTVITGAYKEPHYLYDSIAKLAIDLPYNTETVAPFGANGFIYFVHDGVMQLHVLVIHDNDVVLRPLGDINGDGNVTVTDAVLLLKAVIGVGILGQYSRTQADANLDGVINVADAVTILKLATGITSIPGNGNCAGNACTVTTTVNGSG